MTALTDTFSFEATYSTPSLDAGAVHLWLVELAGVEQSQVEKLSVEERVRAERFVHPLDRTRYIAAHAILRSLLSDYVNLAPEELNFTRAAHGKPQLDGQLLTFNLSHSNDLMLIAVSSRRELGVDIEAIRADFPFEMLADHYFAPEDQWSLRVTPQPARHTRFFEIWTRTEAELKASGVGLGGTVAKDHQSRYSVHSFEPAPGYAAALAVEGRNFDLSCWRWLK
jgi:4'-phosphopantetheinyl transferase